MARAWIAACVWVLACASACDNTGNPFAGGSGDATVRNTGACIVDNQYCYEDVSEARCVEISTTEGTTQHWLAATCSDRAYDKNCPDKPGKYQTCPSSGVSGACVIGSSACRDDLSSAQCRELGLTEGDVMYWDRMRCSERGFSSDPPDAG